MMLGYNIFLYGHPTEMCFTVMLGKARAFMFTNEMLFPSWTSVFKNAYIGIIYDR